MRIVLGAIAMSAALVATEASAQGVNLTGPYQCIQGCVTVRPGDFAFVTQNGWELNMVNEAGQASRAWVDYPGRIWIARPISARSTPRMAWSFNLTTGPYGSAHRSRRPLRRPVAVAADIAGEAGQPRSAAGHTAEPDILLQSKGAKHRA